MRFFLLAIAMLLASPAIAAEQVVWRLGIEGTQLSLPLLSTSAGERALPIRFTAKLADRWPGSHVESSVNPTSEALIALQTSPRLNPLTLQVHPLAGHRSFDAITTQDVTPYQLAITASNTVLGVGLSAAYAVPVSWGKLAKGWTASPFVSVDYNRVDSARHVNTNSPKPFTNDNADTGLTGAAGATISYSLGSHARLRIDGFGAAIASTQGEASERDLSSASAQLESALHAHGFESVWIEYGARAHYRLNRQLNLEAAVVRTSGPVNGSATATMFGLRHSF
jgi:Autotransporter beta-domain